MASIREQAINWTFDRYVTCPWDGIDHTVDAYRYETIINGRRFFLFICDESDTASVHILPPGGFCLRHHRIDIPKGACLEETFLAAADAAVKLFSKN